MKSKQADHSGGRSTPASSAPDKRERQPLATKQTTVLEKESRAASTDNSGDQTGRKRCPVAQILLPLLLFVLLPALYYNLRNWTGSSAWTAGSQDDQATVKPSAKPATLMNYAQFRARYPRYTSPNFRLTEESRRALLFTLDLIALGRHNLLYLAGKQSQVARQSPFRADRTTMEQLDALSQLDEFNLTQALINSSSSSPSLLLDDETDDSSVAWPSQGDDDVDERHDSDCEQQQQEKNASDKLKRAGARLKWLGRITRGLRTAAAAESRSSSRTGSRRNCAAIQREQQQQLDNKSGSAAIPATTDDDDDDDERPHPRRNGINHLDADLRDCMGPAGNQLNCGACYAFSWNAYAEWHYCMQTEGRLRADFSEQHIVDCGRVAQLEGCREGKLARVKLFSHHYGFHLEADYPYKGKAGVCKSEQGSIRVKTIDFRQIKVDRTEWEQLLREQPILVRVNLPSAALSKASARSVLAGADCDPDKPHGMVLVGYGRNGADGEPYWLLRNSEGPNWGDAGYMRLSRNAPMHRCFQAPFISKFKFQHLDEDSYHGFYSSLSFEPSDAEPPATKTAASGGNNIIKWLEGEGGGNGQRRAS